MNIPLLPKKPKKKRDVYLDNAAATKMSSVVFDTFLNASKSFYANPSSIHTLGVDARKSIDSARQAVSKLLRAQPDTIIFTSGATEACNLATSGVLIGEPAHIVVVRTEHQAVLQPIFSAEKRGWSVSYVNVDTDGVVSVADIVKEITPKTRLVCAMYGNNESGAIAPVADIGRAILRIRKKNKTNVPYFFSDASQIPGNATLDVEKLHVDLMVLSGAKIHGPKGVAMLYKRRGVDLVPQTIGGGQEFGFRAGTENAAAVLGFAQALSLANDPQENKMLEIKKLRNYFWKKLHSDLEGVELIGPPIIQDGVRLANNLLVAFHGVESEILQLYLDAYGIYVGVGAACSVETNEESHVLTAMSVSTKKMGSIIRFSLSRDTKKADIDYVMKYLPAIVRSLRLSTNV